MPDPNSQGAAEQNQHLQEPKVQLPTLIEFLALGGRRAAASPEVGRVTQDLTGIPAEQSRDLSRGCCLGWKLGSLLNCFPGMCWIISSCRGLWDGIFLNWKGWWNNTPVLRTREQTVPVSYSWQILNQNLDEEEAEKASSFIKLQLMKESHFHIIDQCDGWFPSLIVINVHKATEKWSACTCLNLFIFILFLYLRFTMIYMQLISKFSKTVFWTEVGITNTKL